MIAAAFSRLTRFCAGAVVEQDQVDLRPYRVLVDEDVAVLLERLVTDARHRPEHVLEDVAVDLQRLDDAISDEHLDLGRRPGSGAGVLAQRLRAGRSYIDRRVQLRTGKMVGLGSG